MKLFSILLFVPLFLLNSCSNKQTQNKKITLSATAFANKIKEQKTAVIIDVRTPAEFSKGHLLYASNYDWNGNDFEKQIALLDKSKSVFVYCLSGGRSSSAANKMRSVGFLQVYELDGGIMKWRGANLPETTDNKMVSNGMTKQEFDALLHSDKLVLIDFYADWCAPCKKMKPYLDEISNNMANKVIVIRINVDDNQLLCKELRMDTLPVLKLYKNKILIWENTGFIPKADVVKQLH